MKRNIFKTLLPILILSLIVVTNCQQQTGQTNPQVDDTDNMIELSQLIVSTIEKYDYTEKGVIPFSRYDQFLHQIFVQGNKFNKLSADNLWVPEDISKLLRVATTEFKKFRYQQSPQKSQQKQEVKEQKQPKEQEKRQFVELQQFYMDLIKHFSEFLDLKQNQERFRLVNEFFFVQDQKQTSQQNLEQQNEKLQL